MIAVHERPTTLHALPALRDAVPLLHTDRLVLRAPDLADFPTLVEIDQSVAATSLKGRGTREMSWNDFMQMSATWLLRGHGWWTVTAEDAPVGFVGIGFEPEDQEPELAYIFAPAARGKGYATEAATAAHDCARDVLNLPSLISYISEKNAASRSVARKLGATRDAEAEATLGDDSAGVRVWRHFKTGDVAAPLDHETPVHHARPAMPEAVPALRTERLLLRAPRLDDFPVLVGIAAYSDEVRTDSRAEVWAEFIQLTGTWLLRGHGWWAVDAEGTCIGFAGIGFEPGDQEPELGYLLAEDAQGRGFATEAAHAVKDCARSVLKLPSLVSYIFEKNAASQNVAQKLGAVRDAAAETALGADNSDVQVWRHWAAGEV